MLCQCVSSNLLLRYKLTNSHIKFYNKLSNFNIIIIDEFGYIPIDKEPSYLLYELFFKLYCNTTILLNTHLKFEQWEKLFVIEKTTKVIIDKITQNCQFIETGNKNSRHK